MLKHWKINRIEIAHATRGWICEVYFAVETHRQFTAECHEVRGYGHVNWHGLFGVITAVINGLQKSNRFVKEIRSIPGGFNNE